MICRYYNLPLCGIEMNKIFFVCNICNELVLLSAPTVKQKVDYQHSGNNPHLHLSNNVSTTEPVMSTRLK